MAPLAPKSSSKAQSSAPAKRKSAAAPHPASPPAKKLARSAPSRPTPAAKPTGPSKAKGRPKKPAKEPELLLEEEAPVEHAESGFVAFGEDSDSDAGSEPSVDFEAEALAGEEDSSDGEKSDNELDGGPKGGNLEGSDGDDDARGPADNAQGAQKGRRGDNGQDEGKERAESKAVVKPSKAGAGSDFTKGKATIALREEDEKKMKDRIRRLKPADPDAQQKGVVYLGRIPHGFYEEEMRSYFSQFGELSRIRLSRNKKTGRSKHYAFLEFASLPVAKIVAETMNNYLMYGHILKCQVVPAERVHPLTFVGAKRKFREVPWQRVERERKNRQKSGKEYQKAVQGLLKGEEKRRAKLKELGVDYDFPGYAADVKEKPKHVVF